MMPGASALAVLMFMGLGPPPAPLPDDPAPPGVRTEEWPAAVPFREISTSWERYSGWYDTQSHRVTYHLYVEPKRLGLYRLTRYRIRSIPVAVGPESVAVETVIYNSMPGTQEPLATFQRTLTGGIPGEWSVLTIGTQPFKDEMRRAIEVYWRYQRSTGR